MAMEEALRAALLADPAILAMVKSDGVAWGKLPQASELPFIALHRITGGYEYTQGGRVPTTMSTVQIDCWAGTYQAAKLLSRAVIARLDQLTAPPFQGCFVLSERDDEEAGDGPDPDRSTDFFGTSLDVRVCHG